MPVKSGNLRRMRRGTGVTRDGDGESEPDDGDAAMATTRVQQPPPAPLACSGGEYAANLPHGGDQAMEDGNKVVARHAAEHTAEGTEGRAAGMRDERAGGAIVSCGARLDGALDVAGETTARTDGDETFGGEGSQGVVPTPMTDTGTEGTTEREVRADA